MLYASGPNKVLSGNTDFFSNHWPASGLALPFPVSNCSIAIDWLPHEGLTLTVPLVKLHDAVKDRASFLLVPISIKLPSDCCAKWITSASAFWFNAKVVTWGLLSLFGE